MNLEEERLYNFLNEVGISPKITNLDCIPNVQKAVYEKGKHLGYCFGRYPKRNFEHFSPELRDVHIGLNFILWIEE